MQAAISVNNLSKLYKIGYRRQWNDTLRDQLISSLRGLGRRQKPDGESDLWALKDVSFEVQPGEVLGVIGRNGAGKSTLLKILARITEPTGGRAVINGRVGSLLEVGTGFHHELTGRENIYLNGAILGMKRVEIARKFDEIVAFSEIEKFLDTPVKRYSSGMYVRLAFAVAAHLEPEILLVDEVLAVGDASFQKKCLGKMGEVAGEGRTVLFVSHNMVAIEGLCNRALVLESGQKVFDGNNQDGILAYHNLGKNAQLIALKDRDDRVGTGEVRVQEISILDAADVVTDHVGMGDDFCVEIRTQGELKNAVIGVLIGNIFRKQVLRGYTWEQLSDEIRLEGNDLIRCYFHNIPLMHGTYSIHTWIGKKGQCVDYVENAAQLIIDPKDVFGSGRILDPGGGIAFCKIDWTINSRKF